MRARGIEIREAQASEDAKMVITWLNTGGKEIWSVWLDGSRSATVE